MKFDKSHGKVTTLRPVYDPFDAVYTVRYGSRHFLFTNS